MLKAEKMEIVRRNSQVIPFGSYRPAACTKEQILQKALKTAKFNQNR